MSKSTYLNFTREGSAPCSYMSVQLEELGLDAKIKTIRSLSNPDMVAQHHINSFPTLVKLDEDGVEVARIESNASNVELLRFMRNAEEVPSASNNT